MRKDVKKEERISPSGYHYFVRNKFVKKPVMAVQSFEKQPSKERLNNLGQFFLKGFKNLPRTLFKTLRYVMMTPIMLLLFVFNLIRSAFFIMIGWFVFKAISGFVIYIFQGLIFSEWLHLTPAPNFDSMMSGYMMPNGVPISYGWEWTIIVIFTFLAAYGLTFKPEEI